MGKTNFIEYLGIIDTIMGRIIKGEEVDMACWSHENKESPEECVKKIKSAPLKSVT